MKLYRCLTTDRLILVQDFQNFVGPDPVRDLEIFIGPSPIPGFPGTGNNSEKWINFIKNGRDDRLAEFLKVECPNDKVIFGVIF